MSLSNDILKEFASLINNKTKESETPKTYTVYGTIFATDTGKFVQIDGSDCLTPISEATDAEDNDRVLVEVKNHKATIIGNFTAPPSLRDSQTANDKADQALKDLEDAKDAADEAKKDAQDASDKAQQAIDKAQESMDASEEAQRLIGEANTQIENLREEIKNVEVDTDQIRDVVKEELPAIIEETVSADYAKKTDLVEVKGELEGSIKMTAGELKTEMNEHYVTQSELVKIEEYLNTRINQNSEEIILSAEQTRELETDTEEIKTLLRNAKEKVRVATATANEAKDIANDAERDLLKAEGSLSIAQEKYQEAVDYYDTIVDKDDATQEEIDAAHDAVVEAEQAVDKARNDVQIAQNAADEAIADAQAAEQALENAKEELSDVVSSVAEMRAEIELTAEGVRIQAATDKVYEDIEEGYYNKEQLESWFDVKADGITSTVSSTVMKQVKDEGYVTEDDVDDKIDDIEIGSRNMCLGTSSEWTEFTLGPEYVVIMRIKMEDLCNNFDLTNGDILTYSVYLKTNSGKRLAASWQKYNSDTNRSSTVSEDIITNSIGRSIAHPVIDTSYEYLDLMVTDLNTSATANTTEYYRCLQLEKGNIVSEWNPAPEEIEERVDGVEGNLSGTNNKLGDIETKVIVSESKIEQLASAISMLVTGEDGTSLLEQTDSGWTFNLSGIEKNIKDNADAVSKLQELINTLSTQAGGLEAAINNLQDTTEWIWMTTYGDEPCIALGESDTSYGLFITNTRIIFVDQTGDPTYISKDGLYTSKLKVGSEFQQRNYIWAVRSNGNYGLMWKEVIYVDLTIQYTGGTLTTDSTLSDVIDKTTVKILYSDGTSVTIRDVEFKNSTTNNMTLAVGNNTISVTYRDITKTFVVVCSSESSGGDTGGGNTGGDTGGGNTSANVVLGSETTCVVYQWFTTGTTASTINYSTSVDVVDGEVVLGPTSGASFYPTTAPNYSSNNYNILKGKYIKTLAGYIYYIDPNSTYTHNTNVTQYVKENIVYNKAYLVMVA